MVMGPGFMDWGRFVRTVSATHLEYLLLESISRPSSVCFQAGQAELNL